MNVSNERLGKKLKVIVHDTKGTILYSNVFDRRLQCFTRLKIKAVFP